MGTKSNSNALGAIVKVYLKSKTLTKYKDGKSGYLSQSQIPLYFGLGKEEKVEKIEIIWPSGEVQSLSKDIPVNSIFIVNEKNWYSISEGPFSVGAEIITPKKEILEIY